MKERGRFGIGSDSNIRLDAAEELRLLEYGQRLEQRARNVLAGSGGTSTGRALFDAALAGGTQALLAGPGGLAAGASLDLVTLQAHDPGFAVHRGDELLDSWIFSVGRSAIDCVWRAGLKLVSNGVHHQRDAIRARSAQALRRLRS